MKRFLTTFLSILVLTGLAVQASDLIIESKNQSFNEADKIQVEQLRDLARDSGQRKLTHSLQNHCASSRSVYLSGSPISD